MREEKKFMRILVRIFYVFCLVSSFSPLAAAADEVGADSHKVPRFVSIRAKEINLRTGPGERYPIDWVLKDAKGWPLEVTEEFDHWRKVKDWEGTTGWVHEAMLSKKQAVVVEKDDVLHRSPDAGSSAQARVAQGTHGAVKKCEKSWCEVEFENNKGWLPATAVWGVDDNIQTIQKD